MLQRLFRDIVLDVLYRTLIQNVLSVSVDLTTVSGPFVHIRNIVPLQQTLL